VLAGLLLALHWATFFWSLNLTTVAVALAVLYLGPVGAAVLAPVFLGEHAGIRVYAGLGLVFSGVFLVARPGAGATVSGVLVALLSASAVTALMLVSKPAVDAVGPLILSAGELVVASVVLSPWMFGGFRQTLAHPVELLTLGVVLTGLSFLLYWSAMRHLPVAVVSVMMHLEPASAVILAAIFLAEIPDQWQWIGIGMVIAGGMLAAIDTAAREVVGAPTNL